MVEFVGGDRVDISKSQAWDLWTVGRKVLVIVIRRPIRKKRVFVSFDFDNDRDLKTLLIGQARLPDSPFNVVDHSLKEAAPNPLWQMRARASIRRADIVLVILGSRTRSARGVLAEVRIARSLGKPIVQIIGRRWGGLHWRVAGAGRVYAWTWPNLKQLLS